MQEGARVPADVCVHLSGLEIPIKDRDHENLVGRYGDRLAKYIMHTAIKMSPNELLQYHIYGIWSNRE